MNKKINVITPHAQIIDEWYSVMAQNNCMIQPKAATILGTILAKWEISTKIEPSLDIYEQYMNTTGGNLTNFWENLSESERAYVEEKRQQTRDKFYESRSIEDTKQLLKG